MGGTQRWGSEPAHFDPFKPFSLYNSVLKTFEDAVKTFDGERCRTRKMSTVVSNGDMVLIRRLHKMLMRAPFKECGLRNGNEMSVVLCPSVRFPRVDFVNVENGRM